MVATGKVMTAVDGTATSVQVIRVAREVARVLGAEVDAVHVVEPEAPDSEVEIVGEDLPLRYLHGAVGESLTEQAEDEVVRAVVVGLRRVGTRHAPGATALAVIAGVRKPVVVVPPQTRAGYSLNKVLVPVQGAPADELENVIELSTAAHVEPVFLHVLDERAVPMFEDQPHYDMEAWCEEFLARWVPGVERGSVMEVRVGSARDEIPRAAADVGADLIVLGWAQDLSEGHARVVRGVLERSPIPTALIPVVRRVRTSATASPAGRRAV
jgi:nucleotide-binding universal stress UspA family protein